jgi:hypothetical protein
MVYYLDSPETNFLKNFGFITDKDLTSSNG